MIALAACSSATVQTGPDKSVAFSRFLTEVYISVDKEGTVTYSSSPQDALQGQLLQALIAALKQQPQPNDFGAYHGDGNG